MTRLLSEALTRETRFKGGNDQNAEERVDHSRARQRLVPNHDGCDGREFEPTPGWADEPSRDV
jgi:hypothetical protein